VSSYFIFKRRAAAVDTHKRSFRVLHMLVALLLGGCTGSHAYLKRMFEVTAHL